MYLNHNKEKDSLKQNQSQTNSQHANQAFKKRKKNNKKNKEMSHYQTDGLNINNQQRSDRMIKVNIVNERKIFRGEEKQQIYQQKSSPVKNSNLETMKPNQRNEDNRQNQQNNRSQPNPVSQSNQLDEPIFLRESRVHRQPNQPSEPPSQPSSSSSDESESQKSQMSQMTHQNFNFEQTLDIQNFILENTIGECPRYRLPRRNIKIDDRFRSRTRYQSTMRELVKFEIVSDVNRRIQQKDEEVYQREIKVKLQQHFIYNHRIGQNQKIVILKASNRNYYFLEETLIKGKRLGIMTRSLPFTTEKLINKIGETRLCFIWKDQKTENILVRGLIQLEIGNPQQQNLLYYNQEKDRQEKLQPNQYFFMDLDSIISSVRQYRAVDDSLSFPLIQQIMGKARIKHNRKLQQQRLNNMASSNIYSIIRRQRNQSQLYAIKNIFEQQNGIYLIQGPPGTGKTESIVNFTSLQQHYFSLGQKQDCSKIMICAQSNAAVNHIGRKILTDGLLGRNDLPHILRLGHTQQFDERLLSINLPHLCQISLRGTEENKDDWSAKLRWQKLVLQAKINKLMKEGYKRNQIRTELDQLYYKVKRLVQINFQLKAKKIRYDQIQKEYLNKSQIVLTTLNTSGKKKFADFYRFKIRCLIIDEASQATQPSTLIPFASQVEKVILVGDHMQLQPTVMSTNCRYTRYNRSLFQRLVDINHIPYLLNLQYRMVLTLQQFPSHQFYQGRLRLGMVINVPYSLRKLSSSSMFFNLKYGKQQKLKKSYQNKAEAYCVSILIGRLMYYDSSLKIGVIAPYKSQIKHLQSQIYNVPMSDQQRDNIRISTVDAFQGQQMDVIIISCVRSNPERVIGFVRDEKRMNVAITRAKYALFVFGNADTLSIDRTWSNYMNHHRFKHSFYDINSESQCDRQIRRLVQLQMRQ